MRSLLFSILFLLISTPLMTAQSTSTSGRLNATPIDRITVEQVTFDGDFGNYPPLSSDPASLVSIGYGFTDRKNLTGSVSSIQTQEIQRSHFSNLAEFMRGRLPGVIVTGNYGNYGIMIRGQSSIYMSNQPLILVNSVPTSIDVALNSISPYDVVSIDVIKDGTAAIYGSRAANGVILIQTK